MVIDTTGSGALDPVLRLRPPGPDDEAAFRAACDVLAAYGVGRVLVTCDDDNAGSRAVIEACGGQLESVIMTNPQEPLKRRYWID